MKNIAEQILEGLSKFYVGFQNRRVLKTMEEIEANTDEQNIPSALLLGEINNKLMHGNLSFDYTGGKLYAEIKDGADTVTPFNNVNVFYSNFWGSSSASLSFTKGKSYIVIAAIVSTHMSSAPSYIGSISNATKSRITYKYGQAQSRYSFVYEIYKITDVKDNAKLYISNPFEAPGIFATLIEI